MPFVHHYAPQAVPEATDPVLAVRGDELLVRAADAEAGLPEIGALAGWAAPAEPPLQVGRLGERACWMYSVPRDTAAPAGAAWQDVRALLSALGADEAQAVGCARQLHFWRSRTRFCGSCGGPTVDVAEERARRCPRCGALFYPSAAPAVIVAVTRGDRLLLAHNRNFRPGLFSLLAGFVDPGETLEQAVAREVREEVGIEITDLRYVRSQPWPFPNSLMVGFRAVHHAGEIAVDGREITEANWFPRDALPEMPRPGTVAREIIEAWRRESA